MAAETHVNDAGTWRKLQGIYVNDGGTWRDIQEAYINEGGTWRSIFSRVMEFQLTVGFADVAGANERRGVFTSPSSQGSANPSSIQGYTITLTEDRLDGGGTFQTLSLTLSGSPNLTRTFFSALVINGKTYSTASPATFSGVGGGSWGWNGPVNGFQDSALVTSNVYTVTLLP